MEGRQQILEEKFPVKFQECFGFMTQLWITVCFSKTEDTMKIEMKSEDLSPKNEACPLSSSAIEMLDKFTVVRILYFYRSYTFTVNLDCRETRKFIFAR